jgi:hypothetical protein
MELIISILTGLFGLLGTPGIVIDRVGADLIRQQVYKVDQLELRVESAPNYQILAGAVDRVRLAGRGVYPTEFLRIDVVDVETDPISIDPSALGSGKIVLRRPFQAAARVVLRAEDVNKALRSPAILKSFEKLRLDLGDGKVDEFDLIEPEVIFVSGNLLRLRMKLKPTDPKKTTLDIEAETKLRLIGGTKIELEGISINLQGVKFPEEITNRFAQNLNNLLDLKQLESRGIIARVLQLEITDTNLQVVGFVRIDRLD